MRITNASGVRNDLLQEIANQTVLPYGTTKGLPIAGSDSRIFQNNNSVTAVSYTVPANKIAIVRGFTTYMERLAAVTGGADVDTLVVITPSGGAAIDVWDVDTELPNIGDKWQQSIGVKYTLGAGDLIEIIDSNFATLGLVNFVVSAHIEEFDAA